MSKICFRKYIFVGFFPPTHSPLVQHRGNFIIGMFSLERLRLYIRLNINMSHKNLNAYQENRYFRTSSFYAAVFLFAKGQTLVNIDKVTDTKRAQFIFLDTPERELLLQSFNFAKEDSPEAMVDARKLIMAIKQLKDKLYQNY